MQFEPVHLPEFGLAVSWAMCRNPMCANFGIQFDGAIPEGRKQVSDDRYYVRLSKGSHERTVGEIQCRYCGQSSRLASNLAIHPIARYFLSLSLPFADCPNAECKNHGLNVFEHWTETGSGLPRRYRRAGNHKARCSACKQAFALGTPLDVANPAANKDRKDLDEAAKRQADRQARQAVREARAYWKTVIEGVRTKRTMTNTVEATEMDVERGPEETVDTVIPGYYRTLTRIGDRLRDHHAWRNARLLRADIANRDEPIRLFTDVIDISLKAFRADRRHALLKVIATTAIVDGTIFVIAAHPFFLPTALCPGDEALRRDHGKPEFMGAWACLEPTDTATPAYTTDESIEAVPDLGRGGLFIRSPYAELAHFLVVQKMLTRFQTIHNTMDGARHMFPAALVAYRDRILAGRPEPGRTVDRRRRAPQTAEVVLFQHDKTPKSTFGARPAPTKRTETTLKDAWDAAQKRWADQEVPADLLKGAVGRRNPRVLAHLFRRAFRGGYSEPGGWAWLRYPPPNAAYRDPRTLWLTRMPGKTFNKHGKAVLADATLQPVDSIFNSIRARVAGAERPQKVAKGQSYRESYVLPEVALAELSIYLFARNYSLRARTDQKTIPAKPMGLMASKAPRPNLLDLAWTFRLDNEHAKRISGWLRR